MRILLRPSKTFLELEQDYFRISDSLPCQYQHLQLNSLSYRQVALDNALLMKWDKLLPTPAHKAIPTASLKIVVDYLKTYQQSRSFLTGHIRKSLIYRGMRPNAFYY